jgi:hypothetical protein
MSDMRPSDLALFLLASGELMPRKRARDQQADVTGLELKRRVLDLLVALDPAPEQLDSALAQIVAELGPPYGPARAICLSVRDEWEAAALVPEFTEWLLDQALRESANPGGGRRRRDRESPNR